MSFKSSFTQIFTTIAAVVLVGCGPSAPDISIHEAAREGNIEAVKHGGKYGSIHTAAAGRDIEAVKEFLAGGADVNAKDEVRGTPLQFAAKYGHGEIVELLIAAGADLEAKNKNGNTSLHFAARAASSSASPRDFWGHEEVVELLIKEGADVNAKNKDGLTPLGYSQYETLGFGYHYRRTETADLLRKHGGKTAEELKAKGK